MILRAYRQISRNIRVHGWRRCLKEGPSFVLASFQYHLHSVTRRRRVTWNAEKPERAKSVRKSFSEKKRILGIYDFSRSPFTLGEILVFQELTLVLRMVHQADKIDLIWLYDPDSFRRDCGLNRDNYHYFFSRLLPLAHVNPHLGSFMLMDSAEMLESYLADYQERYVIVPPYQDAKGRTVRLYSEYFNYICDVFADHGHIPDLSCRPAMVSWGRLFMDKLVGPRIPVVVHMRNASDNTARNANLECWLDFFEHCQKRSDTCFIVIGEKNQLDERFRSLSNLFFAKDHGTTAEQDMALIQACCFYLGSTSGPSNMAVFSQTPYVIFNPRPSTEKLPPGSQHPFATPLQKLVWQPETTDLLIKEFTELFARIDTAKWKAVFQREVQKDRKKLVRRFEGKVFANWE